MSDLMVFVFVGVTIGLPIGALIGSLVGYILGYRDGAEEDRNYNIADWDTQVRAMKSGQR